MREPPPLTAPPLHAPPRHAGAAVRPALSEPAQPPRAVPAPDQRAQRAAPSVQKPVAAGWTRHAAPERPPEPQPEPAPKPRQSRPARRREVAPSRLAYRMERLWLTPMFRVAMRYGMPVLLVALVLAVWLGNDARRAAMANQIAEWRLAIETRPEFMVSMLAVEGADPALDAAVRQVVGIELPKSSFHIDLDATRARVATLDAVKDVQVAVRSGGVLAVTITEREPALIWRQDSGTMALIDGDGKRVALILERADRADLPLVAGDGANRAAAEALALVKASGPLQKRLRGLVRIGERRWDMVLDRDQRIQLPQDNPVSALGRLIALDQAEDLLARDVKTVDLRLKTRPTLRLAPQALAQMRRAQGLETAESDL